MLGWGGRGWGAEGVRDVLRDHCTLHASQVLLKKGYGKEADWWSLGTVL